MLLEIWSIYGEKAFKEEQKLISLTFSLWDDIINWKIRKLGANRLRRIIINSQKLIIEQSDFYETLWDKLVELLWDEENFVKMEAFETLIYSLKFIQKQDFEEKFAPIICEIFEKEVYEHEDIQYWMANLWGQFMHQLQTNGFEELLRPQIIQFFEWLITSEREELRKGGAYNFSYFFVELYTNSEAKAPQNSDLEQETLGGKFL